MPSESQKRFAAALRALADVVESDAGLDGSGARTAQLEQPHGLMDWRGAADFLKLSPATIRKKTAAGELPCIRMGRLLRYRVEALESWSAAHQEGGER